MATAPITVVKKKPLSLKPSTGEAPEVADTPIPRPGKFIPQAEKEPSYVGSGVCAILAAVCFLVLILLQWMEMKELTTPVPASAPAASAAS